MTSERIRSLLSEMTLAEKIGQMCQVQPHGRDQDDQVRAGLIGSLINVVGPDAYHYQALAVEHSRLGIPLLLGRDVIHGFNTIFPIPLGQAASFDPAAVREAAALSAIEAGMACVNWTFSPMIDISRDPRWGRIAESFGEDPLLTALMGQAMIDGYQSQSIAACAKHFVGYGAAEGGRDYSTAMIPSRELHDIYLRPFKHAAQAGVMSFMTAFNEVDGLPCSGNPALTRDLLKTAWGYDGMVVSDWNSITEMIAHGVCANTEEAAERGVAAGVDMEMASRSYFDHLEGLVATGRVKEADINDAVLRILHMKERLGLFERPYGPERQHPGRNHSMTQARNLARKSCVLLSNNDTLPLGGGIHSVALIGPLADAGKDMLGCWVFDADHTLNHSVLSGLRTKLGDRRVIYRPGLPDPRSMDGAMIEDAVMAANSADVVVLCLGEDEGLSGEAHCRAHLELPGRQMELLQRVAACGKPVVTIVFAGRPLLLAEVIEKSSAVLMAWHPGSMAGVAITDILFGEPPTGRLPVSLPRSTGQIPIYYNHKNTGRPPAPDAPSIPSGTPLDPSGFFSTYLDEDHRPLLPFGYGLSYTSFACEGLRLTTETLTEADDLEAEITVTNTGSRTGSELVQLYVRDLVGSVTRPVRELKAFKRVLLAPGESAKLSFSIPVADLAFHAADGTFKVEPGRFQIWLGPDASKGETAWFEVVPSPTNPSGKSGKAKV